MTGQYIKRHKIFRHYAWILVKIPLFSRLDGRVAVVGPEQLASMAPDNMQIRHGNPLPAWRIQVPGGGVFVLVLSGLKSPEM